MLVLLVLGLIAGELRRMAVNLGLLLRTVLMLGGLLTTCLSCWAVTVGSCRRLPRMVFLRDFLLDPGKNPVGGCHPSTVSLAILRA